MEYQVQQPILKLGMKSLLFFDDYKRRKYHLSYCCLISSCKEYTTDWLKSSSGKIFNESYPTERSKKFHYDAFEKDMLLSFLVRDISFSYSCINSSREEA